MIGRPIQLHLAVGPGKTQFHGRGTDAVSKCKFCQLQSAAVTVVGRDVETVMRVCGKISDRVLAGQKASGECFPSSCIQRGPDDSIPRALELPVFRVTPGHIVGASDVVTDYNLCGSAKVISEPASIASVGIEPLGAG